MKQPALTRLVQTTGRLVNSRSFEYFIIAVILGNAALLGLGTSSLVEGRYGDWLELGYDAALGVFIVEALLKMLALSPLPLRYFRDGWNIFDFLVIVFSLVPATGPLAMITRLARLLRVLRLISTVKDLRLIVAALVRSIPSVGHVMMLMSILVLHIRHHGATSCSTSTTLSTGATWAYRCSPCSTSLPWRAGPR